MLFYWILYLSVAYIALNKAGRSIRLSQGTWIWLWIIFTILTGLRHHVGGDWNNYLWRFQQLPYMSFEEAMQSGDIGYMWLTYTINDMGWGGIYLVNFICAAIFFSGLFALLRRQPNPWLGLAVAIPYLIIVVSMGYVRQGVALGFVMLGLASLDKKRFKTFVFFIVLAITFHKSAILMIAFGIFQQGKGKFFRFLALLLAGIGVWSAFVEQASADLWTNYVEAEMQSSGAMLRAILNFIPAMFLVIYRREWQEEFDDYTLWLMIALASVMAMILVPYASTAVDRMSLYFIPIQIVVWSRLPYLARYRMAPSMSTLFILSLYFMVLFMWLNFGVFSNWWIPYRNILWMSIF